MNLAVFSDLPMWNFDGSSTGLAQGNDSDIYLKPIALYPDPFRRQPNKLVFCETLKANNEPTGTFYVASQICFFASDLRRHL